MSDSASSHRSITSHQKRTRTIFPLAHPPPKSAQKLRLNPKLLLQIQQLSPSNRPVAILEVWQPSIFTGRVAKEFPNQPRVRSGDVYVTQSEGYTNLQHARNESEEGDEEGGSGEKDLVGVIGKGGEASEIYASSGRVWEAKNVESGYRFEVKDGDEVRVLEWERKRGSKAKESEMFVLCIADEKGLRRPWIAEMSRVCIEVKGWDRAVRDHLSDWVGRDDEHWDAGFYTLILMFGVYAASQEGWFS
ncbi:hypothetical protein ASPWEDRAFT_166893 [Aspergillus wentii DTO 134E9]|uniref:Uncharacterized protein n=1 Tax=Aspergillus wentii DTO 134E9 TaxID=1073089 RepID=A0A1L9S0Y8_ASPWE|nr:uncharacterized protein ASPWEDRAFT_166893 [Aspergillus wentii DTO 134E9]KAI9931160.1 hypothetical protein MW887_010819 [Aspergillus wentii]OJJ40836.1 hypothetical protein ASPWEDRAFT_166893 [Aspergillus wentii DTO 134E9]